MFLKNNYLVQWIIDKIWISWNSTQNPIKIYVTNTEYICVCRTFINETQWARYRHLNFFT